MGFQETFKALSDPTRREIVNLLKDGKRSAGDIVSHFSSTNATISQVKYFYYELNTSVIDEMIGWITSLKGEEQ